MNIYNKEKMLGLLKDFYDLTGIKPRIYDNSGNELCRYSDRLSDYCEPVCSEEGLGVKCKECVTHAVAVCRKTREQYSCTCRAGLTGRVSPVLQEGQIIGYIALCEMKTVESPQLSIIDKGLSANLRRELTPCIESLPTIGEGKIKSAMRILDACIGYKYLRGLMNNDGGTLTAKIDRYISDNLEHDLSVLQISHVFRLSRRELYSVFREGFDTTPGEYVKSERLSKACRLLCETGFSVSEIAKRVGIADYNYFSKQFKARFAVSPREYRKRARRHNNF